MRDDEVELCLPDGDRIWVSLTMRPVEASGGASERLVMMVDVTERRRMETALRDARDELETRVEERTAELERANECLEQQAQRLEALRDIDQAILCLPLMVEETLIGTLKIGHTRSEVYGDEDRRVGRELADHLAIALRQARLLEQVQEQRERLEERVQERTAELETFAEALDVAPGPAGRLPVTRTLHVPDHPSIFAVGDVAAAKDPDGTLYPQLAPVAIQQGQHAAQQIQRRHRGEASQPFQYRDLGKMATVGRNAGIAELAGGIHLKGALAWLIWAAVHVTKLPGLRNRLIAFMNWVYNYLTYDRKARMIVDTIPLNREAGPEVRRHYRRLQVMETTGISHEFIDGED